MKFYLIKTLSVIFILSLLKTHAVIDPKHTIITDPSVTKRCDELTNKRKKKLDHKARLQALEQRAKRLLKKTPKKKQSVKKKVKHTLRNTIRELIVTRKKIRKLEEQIVRQGCPGINI
jgi:hypothetical protein